MNIPRHGGHASGVFVVGPGHHSSAPRSRHRYLPGRPVPSAEHGHVVPDVPLTLSRAVCGVCSGGERPCQRHVAPHNPSRFETTVDTPRQRPFRHTLPASIRCPKSCSTENASGGVTVCSGAGGVDARGHDVDPSFDNAIAAGDRRARRQVTLSSPPAASKSLAPIRLLLTHCRDTGSDSDVPDASPQSSGG